MNLHYSNLKNHFYANLYDPAAFILENKIFVANESILNRLILIC